MGRYTPIGYTGTNFLYIEFQNAIWYMEHSKVTIGNEISVRKLVEVIINAVRPVVNIKFSVSGRSILSCSEMGVG